MKNIKLLIYSLFSLAISSCSTNDIIVTGEKVQNSDDFGGAIISLANEEGDIYKPFLISKDSSDITCDSVIHIKLPVNTDLCKLITHFGERYGDVILNNYDNFSGSNYIDYSDFCKPLLFKTNINGNNIRWKVNIYDLPVIIVDTPDNNPITSKEIRTEGCAVYLINDDGSVDTLGLAGIRGRGNSTWLQPKKPYDIKFDKKQSPFGLNKSKHWILLANAFYDRTQLHNVTAYEIARETDFSWVPKGQFVELIFNGIHQGLYYLIEKIRVEKNRIDITEMEPTDNSGEALTGGYLIERFHYPTKDDVFIETQHSADSAWNFIEPLYWEIKSPEKFTTEQYNYLVGAMDHMESLIANNDSLIEGKYREYLDVESAIDWMLVEDATLNEEAQETKNMYIYKDRSDNKFRIGPPWDFDAWTFGSRAKDRFVAAKTALYYNQLLKDPYFVGRVKEKWEVYKSKWRETILEFIDKCNKLINKSAKRNEMLWPDWNYVNHYPDKSYDDLIVDMKKSFIDQLEWMDNQIKKW